TSRGSGGNGPSGNVSQQKRKNEAPNGDIHTLSPPGGDALGNEKDVYQSHSEDEVKKIKLKLQKPPSFFLLVVLGIGTWKLVAAEIFYIIADGLLVTQPLLMKEILRVITLKLIQLDISFPYATEILLICFPYQQSLVESIIIRFVYHYGDQVKGGLSGMIFNKTLLLNISSNVDSGMMISLISTDLKNITDFMWVSMMMLQWPIVVFVPLGFLFADFNCSAFVSIGVAVVIMSFQMFFTYHMGKAVQSYLFHLELRTKVTNETLQAIRVVKYSCLESIQGASIKMMPTVATFATVATFCLNENVDQIDFPLRVMPNAGFLLFFFFLRLKSRKENCQLTLVIGSIGSGKTSIAASIIGDTERESGEVRIKGSIAYCPQDPWIYNCSVLGNIIFGQQFNEQKYLKILNQCCLKEDLITLTAGDQTSIGEKGVNLNDTYLRTVYVVLLRTKPDYQ
ncbi:MAG: putative multi drug resistance-associated protein, partial [Streblomastix strix]